jgi:Ca-activated chloride channel family protein
MVEVSPVKFDAPFWLWGLFLVPLVYFSVVFDEQKRKAQFSRFVNKKLWAFICPEMDPKHRVRKARYWLIAFSFLLLALARPQFGTHEETIQVSGLDIMLALDVSNSMSVEDVVPSRLQEAKHLVRSIVTQLDGDRVGVVAFAASSYVSCPLTTDLSYVLDRVQILGPNMIQNQGTDIGLGLETAYKSIERGAEDTDPAHPNLAPAHVVILISDGEDQENEALRAAAKFKGSSVKLYIFGVGTEKGGPIPIKEENGSSQGYKKDRAGHSVVSTFRPDFLMKVAAAAGGKYWNVTTSEVEVQELLQDLGAMNRADYAERKFLVYEDRFQIPLAIAILLLLFELSVPARKMVVVLLGFFAFLTPSLSMAAEGESLLKNPAPLDAYLQNKKGMEAYQAGKIDDAQKSFGAAQARDPSRPELEFNQGAVQMQKGEIDQAIDAFKSSARSAFDKKDEALVGKSLYNLGNAFAKKGEIREAVQSYLGAIHSAQEAKNPSLENEARKNLQLLVQEVKKQKQKQEEQKKEQEKQKNQPDQGNQKDQPQPDKKDSDKQGGAKDKESKDAEKKKDKPGEKQDPQAKPESKPENKENKSDESKQSPTSQSKESKEGQNGERKKKFDSQKMTPEDADRVMSELTTRERELQERLQTQHAKSQNNSKDW